MSEQTLIKRAPIAFGERGIQIQDIESLFRFSQYVAASGLAPKGIEKPESILVAIEMGLEVGLTPMAALQNIAVINGRPSVWGDAQLAIARGSGLMLTFSEEESNDETHPLFVDMCLEMDSDKGRELKREFCRRQAKIKRTTDDYGYSVCTIRVGEQPRFGRFTVADAKVANLWGKAGPWTQYPQRMLKFRARSFLLRDVYGDALKGLLTTEEVRDMTEAERFEKAKPAKAASTVTYLQSPEPSQPTETESAAPTEPATESAATQAESPQTQLLNFIRAEGYGFAEFVEWALGSGQIEKPINTIEELPIEVAERCLRARKGLIKGLQAGREK